jgi:hypothetical protein
MPGDLHVKYARRRVTLQLPALSQSNSKRSIHKDVASIDRDPADSLEATARRAVSRLEQLQLQRHEDRGLRWYAASAG